MSHSKADLGTLLVVPQLLRVLATRLLKDTMERLRKSVPLVTWLPKYNKEKLIGDVIAGVTVGLTVVPQSIAYAAIAGLPPQYGLYSAYLGCFSYAILGRTTQVCIGPTAVMALLTYETCGNNFPECAILTAFYSGVLEVLMAVFRLGCLVKFISEPVTNGFTNAAALTIVSSQLSNLLGLKSKRGNDFVEYCSSLISTLSTIQLGDVAMGTMSILLLLSLQWFGTARWTGHWRQKCLGRVSWVVGVSRNIVCLLLTSVIAYQWRNPPFRLTGNVQAGLPDFQVPKYVLPVPESYARNHTSFNSSMSFTGSIQYIGTGPFTIAVIAVLQNVAICKAFNRQAVDGSQEMIALGISNVLGSFLSAMPVSGSFSRAAVSKESGVRTPAAGVHTGIVVLLALNFLTPSFHYIPKASLSAVIICAVLQTISLDVCRQIWNVSRIDFLVNITTFLGCLLLGMEYGIFVGVCVNMGTLLTSTARSLLHHEVRFDSTTGKNYLLIEPASGGRFPCAEHIRSAVTKLVARHNPHSALVNFDSWDDWDYTSTSMFVILHKEMSKSDRNILFVNCNKSWKRALENAGIERNVVYARVDDKDGDSFMEAIRKRRPSYVVNVV